MIRWLVWYIEHGVRGYADLLAVALGQLESPIYAELLPVFTGMILQVAKAGIAVISLLLSSTLCCASTMLLVLHQALTM